MRARRVDARADDRHVLPLEPQDLRSREGARIGRLDDEYVNGLGVEVQLRSVRGDGHVVPEALDDVRE